MRGAAAMRAASAFTLCVVVSSLTGCATLSRQSVAVDFSESTKAISASGYLAEGGRAVGPDSYERRGELRISREFKVPLREGAVNPFTVSCGAEVDEKLVSLGANALVEAKLTLVELDNPSEFAMNMRVMGSGFMLGGGALAVMMASLLLTVSNDESSGAFIGGTAAGLALAGAGLGVRLWADGKIRDGCVTYRLEIEGVAVKR